MNIQDLRICGLGAVFQFHEPPGFVLPVRVVLDDARLVIASTGEAGIYLTGTTRDATGVVFPVICVFDDATESELRLRKTTFPPRFRAEMVGKLFDWVRGVGLTVRECQMLNHVA